MASPTSSAPDPETPRRQIAQANGACTHLTMTRLWTDSFTCQICLRYGTFGWIYRCTQDVELTLEHDLEEGGTRKLDKFCNIFERPSSPRKGSPAARASKFSFLEEVTDGELKNYTPGQLNTILTQRELLQDTIREHESEEAEEQGLQIFFPNSTPSSLFAKRSDSPSRGSSQAGSKPWLPKKECQFKCCPYCRPTLVDRTFLSLNGIADGDVPATAIAGWGFHLRLGKQKRPVGLVKHVKNLGLRPSPPALPPSPDSDQILVNWNKGHPSHSPQSTSTPQITVTAPISLPDTSIMASVDNQGPSATSDTEIDSDKVREIFEYMTLGPQRQPNTQQQAPLKQISQHSLDQALDTPLPARTTPGVTAPTPMMASEWTEGYFSSAPLEVKSGVAVTEEAVELSVPDLIMEFGRDEEDLWRNGS